MRPSFPSSAVTSVIRRVLGALVVGVVALVATGGLDERTLECEQAIAHLQECCGSGFEAPRACGDGCSRLTLSVETSQCIRDLSCDEVAALDLCARVAALSDAAEANEEELEEEVACP